MSAAEVFLQRSRRGASCGAAPSWQVPAVRRLLSAESAAAGPCARSAGARGVGKCAAAAVRRLGAAGGQRAAAASRRRAPRSQLRADSLLAADEQRADAAIGKASARCSVAAAVELQQPAAPLAPKQPAEEPALAAWPASPVLEQHWPALLDNNLPSNPPCEALVCAVLGIITIRGSYH